MHSPHSGSFISLIITCARCVVMKIGWMPLTTVVFTMKFSFGTSHIPSFAIVRVKLWTVSPVLNWIIWLLKASKSAGDPIITNMLLGVVHGWENIKLCTCSIIFGTDWERKRSWCSPSGGNLYKSADFHHSLALAYCVNSGIQSNNYSYYGENIKFKGIKML